MLPPSSGILPPARWDILIVFTTSQFGDVPPSHLRKTIFLYTLSKLLPHSSKGRLTYPYFSRGLLAARCRESAVLALPDQPRLATTAHRALSPTRLSLPPLYISHSDVVFSPPSANMRPPDLAVRGRAAAVLLARRLHALWHRRRPG